MMDCSRGRSTRITRPTGTRFKEEGMARLTVAGNVHMPSSMKKVAARPDDGLQ